MKRGEDGCLLMAEVLERRDDGDYLWYSEARGMVGLGCFHQEDECSAFVIQEL